MLNRIQFGSGGLYCVAGGAKKIKRSSDVSLLWLLGVTLQTGRIKDSLKTFNSPFSHLLSWKEHEQGVAACLSCSFHIYLSFSLQHLLYFSSQQYLKLFSLFFQNLLFSPLYSGKTRKKEKIWKVSSLLLLSTHLLHTLLFLSLWCAGCQLLRSSIVSWTSTCRWERRP